MTAPTALRTLTEHDVPVTLRDGTVLRATVTRPVQDEPVPVLLVRSPYPLEGARMDLDPWAVLRRGLALVLVSLRGTGGSEGAFEPWVDDLADGADVIEWCASRPWADGAVVTHGRSYLAQTQLFAAGARPPALRAMAVGVCPSDPYDVVHDGGALLLGSGLGWVLAQAGGAAARAFARGEVGAGALDEWAVTTAAAEELMARPGPVDLPVLDRWFPSWRSWVDHPARDGWWAARALPERDPLPTAFVAGWHDIFLRGTLREFSRSPHPASRLVVGPWGHGPGARSLGEVDYGPASTPEAIGLDDETLDLLAACAGGQDPAPADPRVRLQLMGTSRWVRTSAWPPPESVDLRLHLHPGGRLDEDHPPRGAAPFTYVHDPAHPVPTVGGPNLFARGDAARGAGPWDQAARAARPDVVSFVSDPLPRDVDVVGEVRLSLVAATSAVDTDWCATLVDVHPDGRALSVTDGVLRARFAGGDTAARLLAPGQAHRLEVEVGPTAQRFAAGHRVRLDLSSSNHPRFDVNPGTGGTWATTPAEEYVLAHQTVHVDADDPSYLVLPVLPRREQAETPDTPDGTRLHQTSDEETL